MANGKGLLLLGGAIAVGGTVLLLSQQDAEARPPDVEGALANWSFVFGEVPLAIGRSRTPSHLIGRSVSASGTVTNTGDIPVTFRVRLAVPGGSGDDQVMLLDPGESRNVSLSGSRAVDDGDAFTPQVLLDREDPDPDLGIDRVLGDTWFESHPHSATGSLSGWSIGVS